MPRAGRVPRVGGSSAAWRGHADFWRRIPEAGACPARWEKVPGEFREGSGSLGASSRLRLLETNFVQEETLSLRLKRAKQTEAPTLGAEASQACVGEITGLWG